MARRRLLITLINPWLCPYNQGMSLYVVSQCCVAKIAVTQAHGALWGATLWACRSSAVVLYDNIRFNWLPINEARWPTINSHQDSGQHWITLLLFSSTLHLCQICKSLPQIHYVLQRIFASDGDELVKLVFKALDQYPFWVLIGSGVKTAYCTVYTRTTLWPELL